MANPKLELQWKSCFVIILSIILKQAVAMKTINVRGCFNASVESDIPLCTFEMSKEALGTEINCVQHGILQIIGDYKVVHINCSANYPLDFKFDGHKPTEAIETFSWVAVEKNSGRKLQSFHLDVKIFSILSLHDHYVTLYPQKQIKQSDSFNYSRTGNYIFSGFYEQASLQSKFYIFFEEKSAIRSFLRNEDVVINLPNLENKMEEYLPLLIPCRPSHFGSNVTIQQNGTTLDFKYDPVDGFTSSESWKSIIENNRNVNYNEKVFTCYLNHDDDSLILSTKKLGTKYGYDGLPTTESRSIITYAEALTNGTVITERHCTFEHKTDGYGILAVQDVVNPAMYRLTRHFVFPIFNGRSYSTTVLNQTFRFEATTTPIITTSIGSTALCIDATSFHVATIGSAADGRHMLYPFGFEAYQSQDFVNRPSHMYFKFFHDQQNDVLYENQLVEFRCFIVAFVFMPPAIWYTVRANGSFVEEVIDYNWRDYYFSHAQIRLDADVRKILVAASISWTHEWKNFSMDIKFEKSIKPTFDDNQNSIQKFALNSNQILKCAASGIPQPNIYWQRNDKNISSTASRVNQLSILEFPDVQEKDAGDYVCVASNVASVEKKIFTVQIFTETDHGMIIGLSVSICVCGAVAVFAAWLYFRSLKIGKAALTKSEIDDFLNGECDQNELVEMNSGGNEFAHDVTHLRPYNTEFEIAEKRFRIHWSQPLGSGAYGMVVMATLDGISVAVKTVKRNADKLYLKALLSELKVMTFLGDHENIVGLLGASTENLNRGQVFIFVPFCALGSLQEYLRDNRRYFKKCQGGFTNADVVGSLIQSSEVVTSSANTYANATTMINQDSTSRTDGKCPQSMTSKDLYLWATQIARGMSYLSSKKVLHGDLAARNIILSENRIAKITDFGLSRRLYDYKEYAKTKQEPLPWRWMSVESLRDLTFSIKSDVWSYGITLWEIFSLGQIPYTSFAWTMDFIKELESGMRMSCPQFASEELYNTVMKPCWEIYPELRPCFTKIEENLSLLYQT